MPDMVLALNVGSSSIKFGLFETGRADDPVPASKGLLEDHGPNLRFKAVSPSGATLAERTWADGTPGTEMLGGLIDWVEHHLDGAALLAVGHRIVHGGREFDGPVRLTPEVIEAIDRLTPLAPLHQPRSLEPIRALAALRPGLAQVACFDTAFHHGLAPPVTLYAIPRQYLDEGVRRYGFHGLSYEHVAARLRDLGDNAAAQRTVVAHLGSGASLCAMQDGTSRDTTMGFSVLDGLVMGTRCGAIDPGVLLYLQRQRGLSPEALEDMLYHRSGLKGVSGLSADMRTLLASKDPNAEEAVELFCFSIARETAAMANTLQGLDRIVFTGGIGEHSAEVRERVCARLGWLGVTLDPDANRAGTGRISMSGSVVEVRVIPADEERVIAGHVIEALAGGRRGQSASAL